MPAGVIAVSESGLQSRAELDDWRGAGYRAFLIGERFMTDPDPARRSASWSERRIRADARTGGLRSPDVDASNVLKICGITRLTDARHAVEQGATALGFVFWPRSPRFVASEQRGGHHRGAAVDRHDGRRVRQRAGGRRFGARSQPTGITMVQLHGDEPPAYAAALAWPVLRSVTLDDADDAATRLAERHDVAARCGRSGAARRHRQAVDWARAAGVARERRVCWPAG